MCDYGVALNKYIVGSESEKVFGYFHLTNQSLNVNFSETKWLSNEYNRPLTYLTTLASMHRFANLVFL